MLIIFAINFNKKLASYSRLMSITKKVNQMQDHNLLCSNVVCYPGCRGKKIFINWTIYFVTCNCLFLLVVWRQKLVSPSGFPKNRLIAKKTFFLYDNSTLFYCFVVSPIKQKPFGLIKPLFNQATFFAFITITLEKMTIS